MRCLSKSTVAAIIMGAMALLGTAPASAQYDLAITAQVAGTVTNDLFSIADHTRVTLMATNLDGSAQNVLTMQLLGDNGIELRTPPGFDPGPPFPITVSTTTLLTGADLTALFDPANLLFSGMTQAQYYDKGLPPGTYRLCFQSICPESICRTEIVHSPPPPAGCSNVFEIKAAEPPYLLSPPCGETITPQALQAVTFAWTPSSGAPPATTSYRLEIVEMVDPDMAPEEAMASATTPEFFDQDIIGTSFFYGPTQSLFVPGRHYAWRVTAQNGELNIPFANGGHSEVCSFTWGDSISGFLLPITVKPTGNQSGPTANTEVPKNLPNAPWSAIHGTLAYKFKAYDNTSSTSGGLVSGASSGAVEKQSFNPDNTYYESGFVDPAGSEPLGGVRVSLVVTYRILDGHLGAYGSKDESNTVLSKKQLVKKGYSSADLNDLFPDIDKVIATTITKSDGSFSFNFEQSFDTGVFEQNASVFVANKYNPQDGIMDELSAKKVTRTLRLMVDSPYYCSPDKDIVIHPWGNTDLGKMVSWVKTYRFRLTVVPDIFKQNQAAVGKIPGAKVMVLRKHPRNSEIPSDEGDPSTHHKIILPEGTFYVVDQTVADENGVAQFTRVVRPWNANDVYYFYASTSTTKGNYTYKPELGYYSYPADFNQHPIFNSQHSLKDPFETKTFLSPAHPRIFGRVMDKSNTNTPIPQAQLVLQSKYKENITDVFSQFFSGTSTEKQWPWLSTKSGSQGYFHFNDLDVQEDDSGALVGPDRTLMAYKQGYSSWTKHLGILAWGRQEDLTSEVQLEPDGKVFGTVSDLETGAGIPAEVHFDAGITTATDWFLGAQIFHLHAPSGKNQKMTVTPYNSDYSAKTFTVDIEKSDKPVNLGKFQLVRRRHRVRITVLRGIDTSSLTLTMVPSLKPLAGATVELLGQVKKTDPRGLATFVFDNQGVVFKAKITPPENADYVARYYKFFNLTNTQASDYSCVLDPAAHISGVVTVGDSVSVDGAHVFAEVGSGSDIIPVETTTADGGKYTLHGIPMDPAEVTIHATRSSNTVTYVGDSKTITVPTDQPVNLNLTIYNDMDITQLLGIPIEINSLTEKGDGVTIDGSFVKLPVNSSFQPKETNFTLPFHDVSLQKGTKLDGQGVPYAVPQNPPVETMASKLNLRLFDAFDVELLPEKQGEMISVAPRGDGGGEIRGRVRIDPSSFSFSSNSMAPGTLELAPMDHPSATTVVAFASNPGQINADSYAIRGSAKGGAVTYKLFGFSASAQAGGAYVRKDTLAIDTTLHAEVGTSDPLSLDVPAGWVRARPAGVLPIDNPGAVSLSLEKWKVTAAGWKLNASTNGILFDTATVNTGVITVPAKSLHITPTNLKVDQVDLKNISLGGVAPLQVLTQNTGFGYDPKVGEDQKGHWKLSLLPDGATPAAKLAGLPGMKQNAAFTLSSIDLLSNGDQLLGFGASAPSVTFYDVFTLVPGNLIAYDDYFQISGTVDLGVPRLAKSYQAILTFHKDAGKIALDLTPIPFAFDAPGKVKFIAHQSEGSQSLGPEGFLAEGKIQSSEGVELKTKLHRTTKKIWIEVDPLGQTLPIGKTKTTLASVEGEMHVADTSKDWTKFVFSGDMQGAKGMQGDTRKTFTVHGDITADGQGVDVKNIPTPFGDISMTYDYPHGRMTGTLDIDTTFSGTHFVGIANMCVDGDGWYFLTGGAVTLSGFGNLKAGMLIGDYDTMPPEVASTLLQFAYDKHIPVSFQQGISGFFFTGRKNLPQFSIPDTGFNLGAVSAHLGGKTGLDARVWMSFDGPGTELGIGAMGFVHAYFILSSITCTKITGEVAAELGAKGILNTNGQFDLQGCASISLAGELQQCVPTPSLDGISCELCAGLSVQKSLKMTMSMGTSGSNASLGIGTCSGNEAGMSSGW